MPEPAPLTLATWNINSIRMRLARLLDWLGQRPVDILCLQETKVPDEAFPAAELEALGYRALFAGEKAYNGVAILSRREATDPVRALPGDEAGAPRRLLAASVDGLRVICVYAPNGGDVGSDKYVFKLGWYRRLQTFVEAELARTPALVLCGDLNVAPEDRDVWDPEAWRGQTLCSEPEREAFRALLAAGLHDALRLQRPDDGGLYTWWDYRQGAFHRGWGLRIDHILLGAPLVARCRGVEIDRQERKGAKPSDHVPVVATLARALAGTRDV